MYTVFPTIHELSTCLQCQYRLISSSTPRSLKTRQPFQRRNAQQLISQRALHQEAARQNATPQYNIADHHDITTGKPQSEPIIRHVPRGSVTSAQRQARRDSLGVDVLGKPANVIVLEQDHSEPYLRPYYAKGSSTNPKEWLSMSSSGLLDSINKERGIIDADQVCENLEALRRSTLEEYEVTRGIVSDATFERLASKLRQGFEARQLQVYIERIKPGLVTSPSDLQYDYSCATYARSSWRAGDTSIHLPRAPPISKHGKGAESNKSNSILRKRMRKDELADIIMRQCWQIISQKESSVHGEVDIRLQPTHFNLILNHRRNILKETSESHGVELEASRPERIIRISSDIGACSDIVRLFEYMIDKIQCATISIPHFDVLDTSAKKAVIDRTEQLTSTVIKKLAVSVHQAVSVTKFDIYYLGPEATDLDDALRMLRSAAKRQGAQNRQLLWGYKINSNAITSLSIDAGNNLPIEDRHIRWSRWCTSVTAKGDEATSLNGDLGHQIAKGKDRVQRLLRQYLANNPQQVAEQWSYETPNTNAHYWTPRLVSDTVATLGQVIFPTSTAQTAQEKLLKHTATKSRSAGFERTMARARRELLTSIPGVTNSLRKLNDESENSESLRIRLSPTTPPDSSPQLADALPSLEIHIDLSENDRIAEMGEAQLVVEDEEFDVLLPGDIADIRFSKRTLVCADVFDPALQGFTDSSNFDIWGNERLTTPNTLSISIPGHAIRSVRGLNTSIYMAEGLRIDYVFTSLEHHSRITTPYTPGIDINYTIIEAGHTGGRREEISLVPSKQTSETPLANRWKSPGMAGSKNGRMGRDRNDSLWYAANRFIAEIEEVNAQQPDPLDDLYPPYKRVIT